MDDLLIVTHYYPPDKTGGSSRIYELSNNLEELELDVHVLTPHPTFPFGNLGRKWSRLIEREENGIKISEIWTWQPTTTDPNFLDRMANYLIFPLHSLLYILKYRRKYDVVMTTAPPVFGHIPGLFAKKLLGKKWILDVRDLWIDASVSLGFLEEDSLFHKLTESFEKLCLKASDAISVTTKGIKRKLMKKYGLAGDEKFFLLPNGVDTEFFEPRNVEKKNRIIYTGNVGHAQDLVNPVLAMKELKENFDLELLIVGDGDIKEKLKSIVRENELENVVKFKDSVPREEIPRLLSESLIGLAPLKKLDSLDYAVPSKIFEYMACELPFVVSGKGEIRELVDESKVGVVAENSPESFAKEISRILENRDKIESMGEKGRKFVEENYDRRTLAKKLKSKIEGMR